MKVETAACQVICRADAGKDAIDRADFNFLRRDVAADIGQQRNQRGLPHIGTFTAHIRAGNNQHPALRRQAQRVGDERLLQHLFDHRVTAFADANTRFIAEGRAAVVQGFRAFGEVNQYIQFRQRAGALLKVGKVRQQHIEQLLVELFLQRQRFPFRRQYLCPHTPSVPE
ncbi:Uncharacterised protein [Raoultella ornithinolytica]|nr:Uncharacterised protein [Raoultella ornithinolytica]